jgi:hypothetical protein
MKMDQDALTERINAVLAWHLTLAGFSVQAEGSN